MHKLCTVITKSKAKNSLMAQVLEKTLTSIKNVPGHLVKLRSQGLSSSSVTWLFNVDLTR